jgi:uncharacterized protein YwgA
MDKLGRLISIIRETSRIKKPGKKTLQKLVYLIERKGIRLGFDFSIHYYGPYSSELDYAIHRLEMQGVIEIKPEGMTHQISLVENGDLIGEEEVESFREKELRLIEDVITKFAARSAYELEIITTADYVAQQLKTNGEPWDQDSLVEGVRKIKGEKFTKEKIEEAIAILQKEGYFV